MPDNNENMVPPSAAGDETNGKGRSAEQIAAEETKRKKALGQWTHKIADAMIAAALDDAALHFKEGDAADEEQLESLDLMGDYDPILDVTTGSRL